MMTNGKKLLMPRVSYNTLVGTNVTIVIIRERDKVMEALKIKIRDGFFSGTNKVNLESATKTKVVGNGWVATIEKDGTIKCRCIQKDSNGETIVRFALYPNGYSKLTIKEGNNPVKVLVETFSITKNHKVENGEIYLSDGEISNRFGFYRDELFLKFLKKNKIRYVRRDNPNKEYVIRQALLETGKIDETIKTDGTLTEINKVEDENLKGTSFYDISTTYRVDNAKWVVVYRSGHSGRLYTQEKNFLDFKILN